VLLLSPIHCAPLTAARVICKRLKPLLLTGAAGGGVLASLIAQMDALAPTAPSTSHGAKGRCVADPRTVRLRALFLVRRLLSVPTAAAGTGASIPAALPREVLDRLPAVAALLQHLAVGGGAAKADTRALVVQAIAQLRAGLPHSLRRAFLRFLVRFSLSNKIPYRLLAVEIVAKLLGADATPCSNPTEEAGIATLLDATATVMRLYSDQQILAATYRELAVPSAVEAAVESAGYGQDVADYTGAEDLAETVGSIAPAGLASPGASTTGSRRRSILLLGSDVPMVQLDGAATPRSQKGRSFARNSPFYGRASVVRSSPGDGTASLLDGLDDDAGCADPRPTCTVLLDLLLARTSDKAPTVRAKALAVLAQLLSAENHPRAYVNALLLTHLLAVQRRRDQLEDGGAVNITAESDHMLTDVSIANVNGTNPFGPLSASRTVVPKQYHPATVAPTPGSTAPLLGVDDDEGIAALICGRRLTSVSAIAEGSQSSRSMGGALVSVQTIRGGHSALVPLLVRRLSEEGKPGVKKAALAALMSLASVAEVSCEEIMGRNPDWCLLSNVTAGVDANAATKITTGRSSLASKKIPLSSFLPYSLLHRMHRQILDQAEAIAANFRFAQPTHAVSAPSIGVPPSQALGLYVLQLLASKASDPSVSVRKSAIAVLHSIVQKEPDNAALQNLWLACVLPSVADAEATVVARAVEYCSQLMVQPLLQWHDAMLDSTASSPSAAPTHFVLLWSLLRSTAENAELTRCFGVVLSLLARTVNLETGAAAPPPTGSNASAAVHSQSLAGLGFNIASVVRSLCFAISVTEQTATPAVLDRTCKYASVLFIRRGAWMAMELVLLQLTIPKVLSLAASSTVAEIGRTCDPVAALRETVPILDGCWASICKCMASPQPDMELQVVLEEVATRCLRMFTMLAPVFPKATGNRITEGIASALKAFRWSPSMASCGIRVLAAISAPQCATQTGRNGAMEAWSYPILASASTALLRFLSSKQSSQAASLADAAGAVLFVVGEIASIALGRPPQTDVNDNRSSAASVPEQLVTLVQVLLAPSFVPLKRIEPESNASSAVEYRNLPHATVAVPETVRAHAYLCLGKLCLRDAHLAKKFVPVFIRDLSFQRATNNGAQFSPAPPSVRNNILFVLGDLIVRYTSLVDQHAASIVASIADPEPKVRRHAIVLITQLICEDYLKLRAPVVHRLAVALADPDDSVRECAHAALADALAKKNRNVLTAYFVPLLFVLTGCTSHSAFATVAAADPASISASTNKNSPVIVHSSYQQCDASSNRGLSIGPADLETVDALTVASKKTRLLIYSTLLCAMSEEQRITVQAKLQMDVLGGVAEGLILLSSTLTKEPNAVGLRTVSTVPAPSSFRTPRSISHADEESEGQYLLGSTELLVAESLMVLQLPELRFIGSTARSAGTSTDVDPDELTGTDVVDEGDGSNGVSSNITASLDVAKTKMLARLLKRQVSEITMPVCMGLRQLLSANQSPLMHQLMSYLRMLREDHPAEVADALSSDRLAAAELEFDMRQWESHRQHTARVFAARHSVLVAQNIGETVTDDRVDEATCGTPCSAITSAFLLKHYRSSQHPLAPTTTARRSRKPDPGNSSGHLSMPFSPLKFRSAASTSVDPASSASGATISRPCDESTFLRGTSSPSIVSLASGAQPSTSCAARKRGRLSVNEPDTGSSLTRGLPTLTDVERVFDSKIGTASSLIKLASPDATRGKGEPALDNEPRRMTTFLRVFVPPSPFRAREGLDEDAEDVKF
jgi:hypothetical protein